MIDFCNKLLILIDLFDKYQNHNERRLPVLIRVQFFFSVLVLVSLPLTAHLHSCRYFTLP